MLENNNHIHKCLDPKIPWITEPSKWRKEPRACFKFFKRDPEGKGFIYTNQVEIKRERGILGIMMKKIL